MAGGNVGLCVQTCTSKVAQTFANIPLSFGIKAMFLGTWTQIKMQAK